VNNHLKRSVTSNEIEIAIKSLPIKKSPRPDGFRAKCSQIFKEGNSNITQPFP
jgi:hypothetical protein